ncbi:hypothetical protein [Aetokthonos hydrillicola]|uniref:hypothetical protein n=1 Tax=Aetokthonos hydrillicola TaxID=1550245 RepID=UPI0030D93BFF
MCRLSHSCVILAQQSQFYDSDRTFLALRSPGLERSSIAWIERLYYHLHHQSTLWNQKLSMDKSARDYKSLSKS